MKLKNTLKLLLANSRTVLSDLIFRLVFALVFIGIGATFVIPFFKSISHNPASIELISSLKNLLVSFFKGGASLAAADVRLVSAWKSFGSVLCSHISDLTWVSVGIIILAVLYAFVNGMANYASGVAINSHMSSLTHVDYFRAILHKFGRGFLYQFITAVIDLVWTGLLAFLCGLFLHNTITHLSILALTISLLLFVLGKAVFNAFFSNFLPSVVAGGNKIGVALKESFRLGAKRFGSLFAQYTFLAIVIIYLNVSVAICTLCVGILITLPVSYIIVSCMKLVNYYADTKRKYYIDYDNIIVPTELRGEDEQFINGLDL